MKNRAVSPHMLGFVVGIVIASLHLVWSLLVVAGLAKSFLDWIFGMHFLSNPFAIRSFDATVAMTLLLVTFSVGYLVGWFVGFLWNSLAKK
ncbi:hypothetical protein HY947_00730 [Candidatus Gottesmanbacteria bacterium]|nr:hypothetical protein [Candidatus Gottesmanbacteria bacterium]